MITILSRHGKTADNDRSRTCFAKTTHIIFFRDEFFSFYFQTSSEYYSFNLQFFIFVVHSDNIINYSFALMKLYYIINKKKKMFFLRTREIKSIKPRQPRFDNNREHNESRTTNDVYLLL